LPHFRSRHASFGAPAIGPHRCCARLRYQPAHKSCGARWSGRSSSPAWRTIPPHPHRRQLPRPRPIGACPSAGARRPGTRWRAPRRNRARGLLRDRASRIACGTTPHRPTVPYLRDMPTQAFQCAAIPCRSRRARSWRDHRPADRRSAGRQSPPDGARAVSARPPERIAYPMPPQ
jgi:hypothetical protein